MTIPLQAAEHYYLITEPVAGVDGSLPVLEDPGVVRVLPRGGRRADARPVRVGVRALAGRRDPGGLLLRQLPPDWDRMAPYLEKAMSRIPISAEVGVRTFFCGPESFTPDLQPIVGEAPEVRNYFVAAGLNSIGILTGGGIGRALAQWIVDGRPDVDVTGINIDRLHRVPEQPALPGHPYRRVARPGLRVPLPGPVDDDRPRREALGLARPAGRPARVLPRRERLGEPGLVRPAGRRAARRPSCPGAGRTGSSTGRPSTAPPVRA